MKRRAIVFTLSFAIAFAGLCHAQKPAKNAKGQKRANTVGKVTSIDTAKKTLTLSGRQGTTVTVSYTDQTKVMKAELGKIGDLKIGDIVTVGGAVSGNSVEAKAVLVMPSVTKLPKKAPAKAPTNAIRGSVTSTAPLKVRMADTEYEVKTTDTTKVMVSKEGAIADVKTGDAVRVQGQPGADNVVQAQRIEIVPAGLAGKGAGKVKRNKKIK